MSVFGRTNPDPFALGSSQAFDEIVLNRATKFWKSLPSL